MKNKLAFTILFIIIIVISIGIYKFKYYDKDITESKFLSYKIEKIKNDLVYDKELDSIKYKESIIKENTLSIDYTFFNKSESIIGKIYIENDYLYINDLNNNSVKKISNIKFKTMYKKNYSYLNGIYICLLSKSGELYYLELTSNNIKEIKLNKIFTTYKILNFVDLDFEADMYGSSSSIFVLSTDGYIYDMLSGLRYKENVKSLYNKFYAYSDNTLSNIYGESIKDGNDNNYKIKHIFKTYENNTISGKNTIIIITQDNKLIYVNENNNLVYEYYKKVKSIQFEVKYPYVKSNLTIVFEDNLNVSLEASCNQFFCNCNFE